MKLHTPEFEKLKTLWYNKLKRQGFKDVEKNERELHKNTPTLPLTYEETVRYYTQTRHFLEVYKFNSPVDSAIWYLHVEGYSAAEIALALKRSASSVTRIIKKYDKMVFTRG